MNITGSTRTTGIFGYPIRHTLSPSMHNAAFRALNLDFIYLPFEVKPQTLRSAVAALRALNLAGVNITIPHKEKVLRFLDRIDPSAAAIGSVNTIVNRDGVLTGYNTDAGGFLKDLLGHGFDPRGKTVLLVGAGGAGRALASALSEAGAVSIHITDMAESLAKRLSKEVPRARFVPVRRWKEKLPQADLLVNATPAGMHSGDRALASATELRKNLFIYDVIYHRRTELLDEAAKVGARACGGLGMLLHQGALAFELWTGKKAPVEVMKESLLESLNGPPPGPIGRGGIKCFPSSSKKG